MNSVNNVFIDIIPYRIVLLKFYYKNRKYGQNNKLGKLTDVHLQQKFY